MMLSCYDNLQVDVPLTAHPRVSYFLSILYHSDLPISALKNKYLKKRLTFFYPNGFFLIRFQLHLSQGPAFCSAVV